MAYAALVVSVCSCDIQTYCLVTNRYHRLAYTKNKALTYMNGIARTDCFRIYIVGCSGAGKSSLARAIAHQLGIPHLELDCVVWDEGWTMKAEHVWAPVALSFLDSSDWIVDGNYEAVRPDLLNRATHILWLDPSFPRIVRNLFHRALLHPERFHGNRESLTRLLLSKDSILLWACKTFGKRRREYQELYAAVGSGKVLPNIVRMIHLRRWSLLGTDSILRAILADGDRCLEI